MGTSTTSTSTTPTLSHQSSVVTDMQQLLRTVLSSVLALILAAGMMTAQAQTVIVDEDGNEDALTISDGLDQLDNQVGGNGTGTLVIETGDYTGEGTVTPASGRGNLSDVTFEVREDDEGAGTLNELTIEGLDVTSGIVIRVTSTNGTEFIETQTASTDVTLTNGDLNVESDGDLRLVSRSTFDLAGGDVTDLTVAGNVQLGTSSILDFENGTVDITGTLEVKDGTTVTRFADASFTSGSSRITAPGSIDLTYETGGGNISAGEEIPSDFDLGGTLTINGGNKVTFANSLVSASFSLTGDATFSSDSDFTTSGNFDVSAGETLDVAGTLTVNSVGDDEVAVASGSPGGTLKAGSLSITGASTSNGLLDVDGTVTVSDAGADALTVDNTSSVGNEAINVDGGSLTVSNGGTTVNGTGNTVAVTGDATAGLGDVTFDAVNPRFDLTGLNTGASGVTVGTVTADFDNTTDFIEGSGSFTATQLTLNAVDADPNNDDVGANSTSAIGVAALVNEDSDGDFDVGTVVANTLDENDGTGTFATRMDLNVSNAGANADQGRITAAGSEFNTVDVTAGQGTVTFAGSGATTLIGALTNSGTVNVNSDVTYDRRAAGSALDNGSGTISVAANTTLTLEEDDNVGGNTLLINGASDGITGSGTLSVDTGADNGGSTFILNAVEQNHQFPTTETNGSGTVDIQIEGTNGGSQNRTATFGGNNFGGDLTANADIEFSEINSGTADQYEQVSADDITANASITFNNAAFSDSPTPDALTATNLTASSGTVDLPDGSGVEATLSNSNNDATLLADGGTVDASSIQRFNTTDVDIKVGGEVDVSDSNLNILRDFTRNADPTAVLTTDNTSGIRFTVPGTFGFSGNVANGVDSELDPNAQFTISGSIVVNKIDTKMTLKSPIRVNGDLEIRDKQGNSFATDPELVLDDNLLFGANSVSGVTAQGGSITVNGTLTTNSGNEIIFRDPGSNNTYDIIGTVSLRNLRVVTGGNGTVQVGDEVGSTAADISFKGTLDLESGGITIDDTNAAADLSPEGSNALVIRNIADGNATDTRITTANTGTFNDAGAEYDLTYDGDSATNTKSAFNELTSEVQGLTIASNSILQIDDSNVPALGSDTDFFEVATLDVSGTLESEGQEKVRVVDGTHNVSGDLSGLDEFQVGGTATVNGSNADDAVSTLGDVVVRSGADADITDVKTVSGTFDTNSNAQVDLTLADDDDTNETSNPQTITGVITLDGSRFTIQSPVIAQGNINANSGSVNLGDNDLTVADANLTGASGVSYSANSGFLVMEDDETTGNTNTITTNGETVENFRSTTNGAGPGTINDTDLNGSMDVSGTLDIENTIDTDASNDTLTFSNSGDDKAIFEPAETFTGDGTLVAQGTTVELRNNTDISNFAVDSGTSTVTFEDPDTSGPFTVTVLSSFELQSGVLDHTENDVDVSGIFSVASGFSPSTSGSDIRSNEGPLGNVVGIFEISGGGSTTLNSDVSFDRLHVSSLDLSLSDNGQNLTVNEKLILDQQFDGRSGDDDDDIVIADGATIERSNGGESNPLTEPPTFLGDVTLEYTDGSANITSDDEVPSASSSARIDDLIVDMGGRTLSFEVTGDATGNVVVTESVDLRDGDLEHNKTSGNSQGGNTGRRIELDGSNVTFFQRDGSIATNGTNTANILATSNYALVYRPESGDVTTTDREFRTSGSVSSLRFEDGTNTASSDNLELHEDRTVGGATVNRTDGSSQFNLSSSTLTVNGKTTVTDGDVIDLGDDGTVASVSTDGLTVEGGLIDGTDTGSVNDGDGIDLTATGTVSVTGGEIDAASLDADGKVDATGGTLDDVALTTAGDINVDGTTLTDDDSDGDDSRFTLTFDGDADQNVNLDGDITVEQLTLSQQSVNVVSVENGDISTDAASGSGLVFEEGLLETVGDVQIDIGDDGFDRDNLQTTSHVVGELAQQLAGTGNAVSATYPVGAADGTYRPFELFFPDGLTRQNSIAVKPEASVPSSRNGFPVTSEFSDGTSGTFSVSENLKQYSWIVSTSTSISLNQNYEVFAQSDGLDFDNDPALNADEYRLVRRTVAPNVDTRWGLAGTGADYINSPVDQTTLDVRTQAATGDLPSQGTRFAATPRTKVPTFTNSPSDGATRGVDEGQTLTETYNAQVEDPSSSSIEDLSVDAPSSIADSVAIDDGTGELTYSPGFDDAASSPYTLTISATDDQGATGERTLEVSVNDVSQKPAYTAPLDDGSVQEGDTFTRTIRGAIQDPGSSGQLNFSIESIVATGPQVVTIDDNVTLDANTGDPQTAEFTYTPDLDEDAGSPYEVTARITDSDLQTTRDSTFAITVTDDAQVPSVVADDGDLTGNSALDEDGDGQANATVSFTATADDPNSDGNDLSFSINDGNVPFASFDPNQDVTVNGDDATVTVALDPGFDAAANSPYTLTATATDTRNSTSGDASLQVEVNDVGAKPTVATSAGDQTIQEDDDGQANVTVDFTGTAEDPDSDGNDLSFDTNLDFATVSNTSVSGDDKTATIALDPGLEDAGSFTLTVTATDTRTSMSGDATIGVTVNDNPQAPAFVDGEAPSDQDGFVAEEVAPSASAPSGNTFEVQAEVTDPGSSVDQLSASAGQSWADAGVTSTSNGVATITVTLTPPFDAVKTAAEAAASAGNLAVDGREDVSITVTDGGAGESFDEAAAIDLRYDRKIGDVDDSGTFSNADASQALAIAVGKDTRNGVDLNTDRKIRAADFISPNASVSGDNISWPNADTLDANRDHVNSFDALRIFRKANPSFFSSGATAAASAQTSTNGQSSSGAVRVGEVERKDGTTIVPIRLSGNAGDVQATDIEVALTDGASVTNVQANTPDSWMSSYSVTDEGVLKVGMMGSNALKSGRIATVRLDESGSEAPLETGTYRLNGADKQDLPVETAPSKFALRSSYPNPVRTSTTIEYELKEARSVTMEVYNTLGQKVATLVDEKQEAGSYTVNWEAGSQVASGVYFYRIKAGDFTESKRITVVR